MKKKVALGLVFALSMGIFAGCSKAPAQETAGNFTDGEYEGVGEGFAGDIKVKVKVENGKITEIDLLEIQDTAGIGDKGAEETIKKIIETQSTEVDVHSGATISSKGTMEAVEVALGLKEAKVAQAPVEEKKEEEVKEEVKEEAKEEEVKEEEVKEEVKEEAKKEEPKKEEPKKEEPKKEEVKKEEPKKEEPKTEEPKPAASGYKDGTYVGKGEGFSVDIPLQVEVQVKDGKISKVTIIKHDETAGVSDAAREKVPAAIVAKQSPDVEIVSGATFTSKGIMEAVKNALSQAK